ncbi:MAG: beta-N-acetylhexosaminidase [Verrucomicrobiota bacterium]
MALPALTFFPRPRELTLRGGWLKVPALPHPTAAFLAGLPATMDDARAALARTAEGACRIAHKPERGAEGYHLEILASGVRLHAGDAHGVLYGAQTLRQIAAQYPDELPHLEITDSPDLPVRGFMLDVSRTRVPTQAELLALIRALGRLRVNQLQLYVEHTFAFRGHEDAWKDASPLTPAEIRELDDACAALGIELVPNLNTFGHMERWLRHPRYRAMSECPEGWIHPLTGQFKEFPGTLRPDQASLDFVAGLLDDYLPNFRSRQVNIGGDEPWELGQGRSKEAVASRGKRRVYVEHLRKICALAAERGRRPMFWADILMEEPALAQDAPADATPVVWGYDAGHPFDAQCGRLRELGREFIAAPGTSAWQSFTGRLDNALTNQAEACAAALRHGARGTLTTTWGDGGHHQPWPTSWLPMTAGLAMAWRFTANLSPDHARGCSVLGGLSAADGAAAAETLRLMGTLDGLTAKSVRNRSLSWDFLTCAPEALPGHLEGVKAEEAEASLAHLDRCRASAAGISDRRVREELTLGVDLAAAGFRRALGRGLPSDERASLLARHREVWLRRSRPGGLDESCALLFGEPERR